METQRRKDEILDSHDLISDLKKNRLVQKQKSKVEFLGSMEEERRAISTVRKDEKQLRIQ
jgi:hypothetical protein